MALSVTSAIWQQVNSPALDIRRFISALVGSEGVVASGDMLVAQRAAGANMSVDIAAGRALVQGDAITQQGMYFAYNDGTVNLTGFTAAHATNPRIDRVCLRVRDAFHGDAANDVAFVIVTGTATAGATLVNLNGAAAVPAGHLLLANILIPATATTITTANIGNVAATLTVLGAAATLAYNEITSNVSVTATSGATANNVVSASAVTFDGATPALIEFSAPSATKGTNHLRFVLYDGSTELGIIGSQESTSPVPVQLSRRLTPSAGSHTYHVKAYVDAGTGTVAAGTGAAGAFAPAFIRITRG